MKQTTIAAALISVLVLVTVPVSVGAASFKARQLEFGIDHFKCYQASATPFMPIPADGEEEEEFFTLVDQFDNALNIEEKVQIFLFMRFCNPAGKLYLNKFTPSEHEGHLTLYFFNHFGGEPDIQGSVNVVNQFGQQHLEIHSARILAVPTLKQYPGDPDESPEAPNELPKGLDHYKCYYANGHAPDPGVVGLFDQFETHTLNHQIGEPVLFCNPVVKTEPRGDSRKFPGDLVNSDDHLTCYKISILDIFDKPAWIYNQFTPKTDGGSIKGWDFIAAKGADILCVPSKKRSFKLGVPDLGATTEQCRSGGSAVPLCATDADCNFENGETCAPNDTDGRCECMPRPPR